MVCYTENALKSKYFHAIIFSKVAINNYNYTSPCTYYTWHRPSIIVHKYLRST